MTMEQLESYHSPRTDSICPGQPEIENGVVEVTTGPLGQGLANAVGLAMATKSLVATYNRPTHSIVDNMTWCMVGDECLQEGVTFEAICMAGHWKLNNLCVMYDNNQITCNGTVNLCNTEDINMTMRACGWDVIGIVDGSEDVSGIVQALWKAREATEIPTFINIKTIIGIGSESAGDTKTHGAAFGPDDIANMKRRFGKDPEKRFDISDEVYSFFSQARSRGLRVEDEWSETMRKYALNYPELFDELKLRMEGKMNPDWRSLIPKKDDFPTTPTASRKSAGLVCNPLAAKNQNMMVGTADLSPSVNMIWKGKTDFQHVRVHSHPRLPVLW